MRYFWLHLFLYLQLLSAQSPYAIRKISPELKKNSIAVLRNENTQVTLESVNKMRVRYEKVISVLESRADIQAFLNILYNDYTHIKSYSYEIYDSEGKLIKKLNKRDFKDYSAVSGATMYSDYRVLVSSYQPNSYPYTVKYSYEKETENTILVPSWTPIEDERISVEKSSYTFVNETDVSIAMSEKIPNLFDVSKTISANTYHFEMENQAALLKENHCPSWDELTPKVRLVPHKFYLSGEMGEFNNWQEFGYWVFHHLVKFTRDLPQEEINYVKELIKNADSQKEKIHLIYEYLQNKTRYISIQIGIGGWKPFAASHVSKNSYGDCKGLSNYFVSLLEAVGIPANYTIVYGTRNGIKNIDPNFASIQGNHVIVNVPLETDTIWLECTSQNTAFNHLGKFTHNRYALSVNEKGGEIVKTKQYGAEDNWAMHQAQITLSGTGDIELHSSSEFKGLLYDRLSPLEYLDEKDKREYIYHLFKSINHLGIKNYSHDNDKDNAVNRLKLTIEGENFGQIIGNNMIFEALSIFQFKNDYKKDLTRKYPLVLESSQSESVNLTFEIPKGYVLKTPPEEIIIENEFGSYHLSFLTETRNIRVRREYRIAEGTFALEKYNEFVSFLNKIQKADHCKILIEKSETL